MYTETMPRESSDVPMPPCCPNCWEVMNLRTAEPWTLLRGHQLNKYVFECNICGYSTTRMMQDDR